MSTIAVNQKFNSCEGCYNLVTGQIPHKITDDSLPFQDIVAYCKCYQPNVYRSGDCLHFEYRIIDDPTIKPSWCPL